MISDCYVAIFMNAKANGRIACAKRLAVHQHTTISLVSLKIAHRLLNPATVQHARALVFSLQVGAAVCQTKYPPRPGSQGPRNSTLVAAAVLLP
jgi:hypothetical protein